MAQAYNKDIYR